MDIKSRLRQMLGEVSPPISQREKDFVGAHNQSPNAYDQAGFLRRTGIPDTQFRPDIQKSNVPKDKHGYEEEDMERAASPFEKSDPANQKTARKLKAGMMMPVSRVRMTKESEEIDECVRKDYCIEMNKRSTEYAERIIKALKKQCQHVCDTKDDHYIDTYHMKEMMNTLFDLAMRMDSAVETHEKSIALNSAKENIVGTPNTVRESANPDIQSSKQSPKAGMNKDAGSGGRLGNPKPNQLGGKGPKKRNTGQKALAPVGEAYVSSSNIIRGIMGKGKTGQ